MASTRALSKRLVACPLGPTRKAMCKKKKKMDAAARRAKVAEKASKKKRPVGLLELPAEIRNTIYELATESKFEGGWTDAVPLVTHNPGCDHSGWSRRACCRPRQWLMDSKLPTARQFLGLTQVCKQLREEYRPIWLRNSSVRVKHEDVADYIYTFHGLEGEWQYVPEMLQISVCQPLEDSDDVMDLTLPLRIHAHSKGSKVQFVPYELTLGEVGAWNYKICNDCSSDGQSSMEVDGCNVESAGCAHMAQNYEDYLEESLGDRFPYVVRVNNLLAHDNPFWLHDIERNNVIAVQLHSHEIHGIHIPCARILLHPQVKLISATQDKASLEAAVKKYLNDRSIPTMAFEMIFRLFPHPNLLEQA